MSPGRADICVHVYHSNAISKSGIKAKFSCTAANKDIQDLIFPRIFNSINFNYMVLFV